MPEGFIRPWISLGEAQAIAEVCLAADFERGALIMSDAIEEGPIVSAADMARADTENDE